MPDVGEVFRTDVIGDFDGTELLVNSYQFLKVDVGTITDAELLDDLETITIALYTILKALSTVLTIWRRIHVHDVTNDLIIGDRVWASAQSGTMTGEPGITQGSAVVNFPTNVPRVTMRKYFGPIGELGIDSTGQMSSAVITPVAAAVALLIADFVETNGTYHYGYESPKALTFKYAFAGNLSSIPGTLRSRKQGVGV